MRRVSWIAAAFRMAIVCYTVGYLALGTASAQLQSIELSDSTAVRVLKGTLLLPENTKGKIPLVIFIAGSGPTDRDGNSPGMKSDYLKMLAEGLSVHSIATFRYDKRGVGKSKSAQTNEELLVFEDFARDAASWISAFKKDNRFSRVIVAGHSEGSLLGMLAVNMAKADAFISLAGAGRPIDVILKEQLRANPYNPPQLVSDAESILDSLKAGHRVKQVSPMLAALFRPSIQPYIISWLKHDPAEVCKALPVPVMIVQGSTDIQVSITDAEHLRAARPDARYLVVDGMNHVFRDAPADRMANIAVYSQTDKPLSSGLIPALVSFILSGK
jgi:uncharacterized protein